MKTSPRSSRRLSLMAAVLLSAALPALQAQFGAPVVGGTPAVTVVLPSVALNSGQVVNAINVAAFDQRERLLNEVEAHIARAAEAVAALNNKSPTLDSSTLQSFRDALSDARTGDITLKRNLQAAREATAEQWNDARAALTSAYTAYAANLVKLEASLGTATDVLP